MRKRIWRRTMNKHGIIRVIYDMKRLIWILAGALSIILLLRAYVKMVSQFIVHIVILLAGIISALFVYKNAKRMRYYLCTMRNTICNKSKKWKFS